MQHPSDMAAELAYDDVQGPRAIIELQMVVGVSEPAERAKANWAKFSSQEKLQTTLAHKAVLGGFKDNG